MKKEPFVITSDQTELPNLITESDEEFPFEYSKTNVWSDSGTQTANETAAQLEKIIERLDDIIKILSDGK